MRSPFDEHEPDERAVAAARVLMSRLPSLDEGKMFGVLVVEGAMTLTIGGTAVRATPGSIVRMPGGVPHALEAAGPTRLLLVMLREPKGS